MSSVAGAREALLIATGKYDNKRLRQLRSPVRDAKELAVVLEDPMIGSFNVQSELNKPHHEVAQSIERFFQQRSPGDLLLVHLSCHGLKDGDGQLYFATVDTNPDLPASTSIPAEFLRNQLLRSRARSIVLLLDCCYSGSFLTGMKAVNETIDIREELAGQGRAVITATNRTEYAWEGESLIELEPELSKFTGLIVEGLRTGDADLDHDGKIAVDELYDYVYARLHYAKVRQTPRKWVDLEYQVFIASSKHTAVNVSGNRVTSATDSTQLKYRTQRGSDETIRVELSLVETAFGCVKELRFNTSARCANCGATGTSSREMPAICEICQGTGRIAVAAAKPKYCKKCDGFGTFIQNPCSECLGEGRIHFERTIKVRTPKGVEHGTLIQLAGEGEVGPHGGPPGDIFLEIIELDDPRFKRHGDDLYTMLRIPASQAVKGGEFELETLDGKRKVRIKSRVSTGSVVRLNGLGVPHLDVDHKGGDRNYDSSRGDLMINIEVS